MASNLLCGDICEAKAGTRRTACWASLQFLSDGQTRSDPRLATLLPRTALTAAWGIDLNKTI